MKEQALIGIKVKYVRQSQIPRNNDFLTHDRGTVEFRSGARDAVVMYEAAPSPLQGDRRKPLLVTVTWKPEDIAGEHDYFKWLLNLAHVHDVYPTTTEMSPPWIRRKQVTSAGSSGGSDAASDTGLFTKH